MVQPLVRTKIVKKRTKPFFRNQSDRHLRLGVRLALAWLLTLLWLGLAQFRGGAAPAWALGLALPCSRLSAHQVGLDLHRLRIRHLTAARRRVLSSQQTSWRRPKGIDSRCRRKFKGTTLMPNIGYGSAKKTKHMLPNGACWFVAS